MLSRSSNCTYRETGKYSNPRRRPVLKSGSLPMYIIPTYLENPKAPPDWP